MELRNISRSLLIIGISLVLISVGCISALGEEVITVGFRGDPGNLDPASGDPTNNTWFIHYQTYERLTRASKENPDEVKPILASSWESQEDGQVWIFHLREGVEFQNGASFTAEDVKYSFNRVMGIGVRTPSKWFSDLIDSMEIMDEHQIKFTLKKPYPLFPNLLSAMDATYIVDSGTLKEHATNDDPWAQEWARSHLVGTGPYELTEWKHGQYLTLEKNEDYWGGWDGKHFDKIQFKIVRESSSRKIGVMEGSLDYVEDLSFTDIPVLKSRGQVDVHTYATSQLWMIHMNNQRPPLDDVNVRKALTWAFPYQDAVEYIFQGYTDVAQGALGRGMAFHNDELPVYSQDLEKAKSYLDKAGYEEGEIKLNLYYISGIDFERRLGEVFQSNLAEIGIDLELESAPWPTLVEMHEAREPEERPYMAIRYNAPDYNGPFTQTLVPIFGCDQSWNWSAYCSSEYEDLLEKYRTTTDQEELKNIAYRLQELVVEDAVNLYLCEGTGVSATRSDIKGYYTIPFYPGIAYVYDMYRE